jgi:3-oxoadipate enol-lactonase
VAEVENEGARIHHTVDGPADRPVLLLSNSLGTTTALWDAVLPPLATRFRVVRYDQRGHGRSSAPAGPYRLETLARDALAVLDAVGAARAFVAGISLGGMTALRLALDAPDRVEQLILANTGAAIGTAELWNERIRAVEEGGMEAVADGLLGRWFTEAFRREEPDIVARFRSMLTSCPVAGYCGCCAAIRDADLRPELGQVGIPTLVIVGSADVATPPASGAAIRDGIPYARLTTLRAAHLSPVERPADFAALVLLTFDQPGAEHG